MLKKIGKKLLSVLDLLLIVVLALFGIRFLRARFFNNSERLIKSKKKKAEMFRKKAEKHSNKAIHLKIKAQLLDKDRAAIRNKYSKIVPVLLFCLLLPLCVSARYIVYDPEEKVNRDYGTITNYVKSLEEEKRIQLAVNGYLNESVSEYSNAYVSMSNAYVEQKEINDIQEGSTLKKVWEYIDFYVGVALTTAFFLLF